MKEGKGEDEFNLDSLDIRCNMRCASKASMYALRAAHDAVAQAQLDLSKEKTQLITGALSHLLIISLLKPQKEF